MVKDKKKLKILFVSQYFPPEVAAPAVRVHETCREWVKLGHDVTVLCGFPHHPTGVVPEKYKRLLTKRENWDGIKVVRTWLYAAPNKGVFRRSLCYVSFMLSAIISGMLFVRKVDVVIATSPQLLVGVSGWVLSRFKRCPFFFEVRDLWPDALVAVGVCIPGPLFSALKFLERFLYERAQEIVVVTNAFRETIADIGGLDKKIAVIPTGIDLDKFQPGGGDGWGGGVAYIGTLGLAHRLDFFIETASEMPTVPFNLIGDGADRQRLELLAGRLGTKNLRFWGLLPRDRIPSMIYAMDVCVVALRDSKLFHKFIPSKMFEVMACERPMIVACAGEAAEIARRSGGAIVVPPEDKDAFKDAIQRLLESNGLRSELGRRGRRFVQSEFDRKKLSTRYIKMIKESVQKL
jgi:glycosyltransferase involved in cell wall biosynthesis